MARKEALAAKEDKAVFSIDLKRSLWPLKQGDLLVVKALKYTINGLFLVYLIIMAIVSYIALGLIG